MWALWVALLFYMESSTGVGGSEGNSVGRCPDSVGRSWDSVGHKKWPTGRDRAAAQVGAAGEPKKVSLTACMRTLLVILKHHTPLRDLSPNSAR